MNRNDPCSCGSGKRYKHCHGASTGTAFAPAPPPRADDPLQTLHLALAQQQAGRLAAAEALYEQALAGLPDHFDALHMLGVVKMQLGKFEEGARLLLAGLPLAPAGAAGPHRHNLALCLIGLARQRGVLDTLGADPPAPARSVSFLRACAIPSIELPSDVRVSVLVVGVASASDLERSLASVQAQSFSAVHTFVALPRNGDARGGAAAACAPACSLVGVDVDAPLAAQVDAAAAVAAGTHLALMHAGDRWAPGRLQRMVALLQATGAQWGFSGLRVVREDDTIATAASSPEVAALMRAQDAMYAHRAASLALLGFDPIAAGRNLVVKADYWRRHGGLRAAAAHPFLDWAWRRAFDDEPAYLDEPDCLIAEHAVPAHLAEAIALTASERFALAPRNPRLAHGLALLSARHWRDARTMRAYSMSPEALQGCAAMLGVLPPAAAQTTRGPA
jgi:hypothetical protein